MKQKIKCSKCEITSIRDEIDLEYEKEHNTGPLCMKCKNIHFRYLTAIRLLNLEITPNIPLGRTVSIDWNAVKVTKI